MNSVLVDTGPLVAILASRDQYHSACVEVLKSLRPPLVTCWPVITEAAYLLRQSPAALQSLFRMLERGFLVLAPLDYSAAPWFAEFFDQYHDQEPQLADAAIVYLAGREGIETIFTLDHRHFSVFRLPGNRPLTLLPQNR